MPELYNPQEIEPKWQKQWEALSDYHLFIPDLPGHGRLSGSPCVTVEEGARLIADLIRQQTRDGKAHVEGQFTFPLSTTPFLSRHIPVCGGGYLRLFPLWFTILLFSF